MQYPAVLHLRRAVIQKMYGATITMSPYGWFLCSCVRAILFSFSRGESEFVRLHLIMEYSLAQGGGRRGLLPYVPCEIVGGAAGVNFCTR